MDLDRKKALSILLCLICLTISQQALSWGALGHQLVCDIAWREMSQESRKEIRQLLKGSSYRTFAQACNWPDHIKKHKSKDWLKPYHYINVNRFATSVVSSDCAKRGCVLSGIDTYTSTLKSAYLLRKNNKSSKSLSNKEKRKNRESLLLVSHFIADVHQPLHVSYADDWGGNKHQLTYQGRRTNLHRLWDSDMITTYYAESNEKPDWRKTGDRLYRELSADMESGKRDLAQDLDTSTMIWAIESYNITRQVYTTLPKDGLINDAYVDRYVTVLDKRIKQAGLRLAHHLDSIFNSTAQ